MSNPRPLLLVLLAALAPGCSAPSLDLTPRLARLDLDGQLAASAGPAAVATSWDRLGLDDETTVFAPRADLHVGALDLTLDYAAGDFSGTGTTDGQLDVDGVVIPAGATVDSALDLAVWRLTGTFDLFPTEFANLGLGIGLAAADFEARLTDTGTTNTIDTDEVVPLPFVAVRAGLDWGDLEAEALLGVLSVDVGDAEGSYLDLDLFVRYHVLGGDGRASVALVLGYRYVDLEAEYDDGADRIDLEAEVSGPYFGGTIVL